MSATPVGQRAALHAQRITFFFASGQSRMRPTLPSGSANLRIIFLVAQGGVRHWVSGRPHRECAGMGRELSLRPSRAGLKSQESLPEFGLAMADSLRQEIADLKGVAEGYAARWQRIDNLAWPNGMRIAVNFTADFDAMLLRRLHNEPPMQL